VDTNDDRQGADYSDDQKNKIPLETGTSVMSHVHWRKDLIIIKKIFVNLAGKTAMNIYKGHL
jgi:hypothetical protein